MKGIKRQERKEKEGRKGNHFLSRTDATKEECQCEAMRFRARFSLVVAPSNCGALSLPTQLSSISACKHSPAEIMAKFYGFS